MHLSIKHWPEQERPRERLIQNGAASLSDAELLAIFLRSGSQQHSAVELARLLIQHFGNLNYFTRCTHCTSCVNFTAWVTVNIHSSWQLKNLDGVMSLNI